MLHGRLSITPLVSAYKSFQCIKEDEKTREVSTVLEPSTPYIVLLELICGSCGISSQEYFYSPLDGILVHHRVTQQ